MPKAQAHKEIAKCAIWAFVIMKHFSKERIWKLEIEVTEEKELV